VIEAVIFWSSYRPALQATWLLQLGCLGFLACVLKEKYEVKIEDITIGNEYLDIFREEFSSIQPTTKNRILQQITLNHNWQQRWIDGQYNQA